MKFSFTMGGGLGDYIQRYLGFPGDRLHRIYLACPNEVQLRVSSRSHPGMDLLQNNPFFKDAIPYNENSTGDWPKNQIDHIAGIHKYPKSSPRLWLDDGEEDVLLGLKKPYAVFHPFAGGNHTKFSEIPRELNSIFDTHYLAQWVADTSGLPLVVLGVEDFGYESENVFQVKGSVRLSVRVVEQASFFLGSHSSMQCAAWVYNIPSMCIGPGELLFHNVYSPTNHKRYLRPMFANNNVFMLYEQADQFACFFEHFLRSATSLKGISQPVGRKPPVCLKDQVLPDMDTGLVLPFGNADAL